MGRLQTNNSHGGWDCLCADTGWQAALVSTHRLRNRRTLLDATARGGLGLGRLQAGVRRRWRRDLCGADRWRAQVVSEQELHVWSTRLGRTKGCRNGLAEFQDDLLARRRSHLRDEADGRTHLVQTRRVQRRQRELAGAGGDRCRLEGLPFRLPQNVGDVDSASRAMRTSISLTFHLLYWTVCPLCRIEQRLASLRTSTLASRDAYGRCERISV